MCDKYLTHAALNIIFMERSENFLDIIQKTFDIICDDIMKNPNTVSNKNEFDNRGRYNLLTIQVKGSEISDLYYYDDNNKNILFNNDFYSNAVGVFYNNGHRIEKTINDPKSKLDGYRIICKISIEQGPLLKERGPFGNDIGILEIYIKHPTNCRIV